jgi:tRNA modification GTPase
MERGDPAGDTIAAVATPPGRGGIGIVRVSGAKVADLARAVLGKLPPLRQATLVIARDAQGRALDQGIALYYAAPSSYTGEDVLEFQGHGGHAVMNGVLAAFLDAGARLAEPGEYTRRAFLNDRLDLAQAEAVADLIDASSKEAARSAIRSLSGEFSRGIEAMVAALVELRALAEAMLDFPEEEVDTLHRDDALERLGRVRASLADILLKSRRGSLLREGIHVVIAGRPNVGKSSLLNRLAGEERAIVTPIPGTTRDALREPIQIDGVPLIVVDTAGLRESRDELERLGMQRTQQELERADLVLAVFDASRGPDELHDLPSAAARIYVYNKVDLVPGFDAPSGALAVSARTGEGLDALRRRMLEAAGWSSSGEPAFLARERHLRALVDARGHLAAASDESRRWEFFAEELRLAHAALGSITGEFSADDLLGEIFARFCIGK